MDVGYVPPGVHLFVDGGTHDNFLMEAALQICDEVHVISAYNVTDVRAQYREPPLASATVAWTALRAFQFVWRRHTLSNVAQLLAASSPPASSTETGKRVLYVQPRVGDVVPSYADWADASKSPILDISYEDGKRCAQLAIDAAFGPGTAPSSRERA